MRLMKRRNFVIHTPEEIVRIREAARVTALAREEIAALAHPGMTTLELDELAGAVIRATGGIPTFLNYNGFPRNICISVNDVVVHGIASEKCVLKEGDIVSVDVGVTLNGGIGDTAKTVLVGNKPTSKDIERLLAGTEEALEAGIAAAKPGGHVGDISRAVAKVAGEYKLGIVRDLVGHGCGTRLHEPPEVPNFVSTSEGPVLAPGMVLCIEPMLNLGTARVYVEPDQWTVRTADGQPSAHFEHMILITETHTEVLTRV